MQPSKRLAQRWAECRTLRSILGPLEEGFREMKGGTLTADSWERGSQLGIQLPGLKGEKFIAIPSQLSSKYSTCSHDASSLDLIARDATGPWTCRAHSDASVLDDDRRQPLTMINQGFSLEIQRLWWVNWWYQMNATSQLVVEHGGTEYVRGTYQPMQVTH